MARLGRPRRPALDAATRRSVRSECTSWTAGWRSAGWEGLLDGSGTRPAARLLPRPRSLLHLRRSSPGQLGFPVHAPVRDVRRRGGGVHPHLRVHRGHGVRARHGAAGLPDRGAARRPAVVAALRRARVPVHGVHGDDGVHGRSPEHLALRRGVPGRRLPEGSGRGGGQGADPAVPAGLHGHPPALHRAAGRPPLRAGRVPVLAVGRAHRLARVVAGGPDRLADRALGLSRSGPGLGLQSVRLAGAVLPRERGSGGEEPAMGCPGSTAGGCSGWPRASRWSHS